MNINKFVDKEYETKTFKELADAPLVAIQGITEDGARLLNEALPAINIKTVRDLANLKFVRWAQAICVAADGEE